MLQDPPARLLPRNALFVQVEEVADGLGHTGTGRNKAQAQVNEGTGVALQEGGALDCGKQHFAPHAFAPA